MELEQYKDINQQHPNKIITIGDLVNKDDRTLLYGYTCDRYSWHVYIKNKVIHTICYNFDESGLHSIPICANSNYIPDKRLYPNCCDYEFCSLLKNCGEHLCFTTFDCDMISKKYWGYTL